MADKKLNTGCAVALGNFDGVHTAHRKVLDAALSLAEKHNVKACAILFDIHPKSYITKSPLPTLLTSSKTKEILSSLGFEVVTLKFAQIQSMSAAEFFEEILIKQLGAKALCCGFNYSFGKNGAGSSADLQAMCSKAGVDFEMIPPVEINGETVSSTAVRKYIAAGEPEKAALMLGRNYTVCGKVVEGDQRGRTWGFPTANQIIDESLVVPKYGVYETKTVIDDKEYKCVTNIGIRPTYLSKRALAETHIIGFSGDLYGKEIEVELIRFIRPEKKFDSAQKLIEQLKKDISEVTGDV